MRFEWNEAKNRINFTKHGLSFEDAELVFSRTMRYVRG